MKFFNEIFLCWGPLPLSTFICFAWIPPVPIKADVLYSQPTFYFTHSSFTTMPKYFFQCPLEKMPVIPACSYLNHTAFIQNNSFLACQVEFGQSEYLSRLVSMSKSQQPGSLSKISVNFYEKQAPFLWKKKYFRFCFFLQ